MNYENDYKNTVRFRVELFDNRQGEVWSQEFHKPLLNYEKHPETGEELKSRVSAYDLFNEEVIQTVRTYNWETHGYGDDDSWEFRNSYGQININFGQDKGYEYTCRGDEFFDENASITILNFWDRDEEYWKPKLTELNERIRGLHNQKLIDDLEDEKELERIRNIK